MPVFSYVMRGSMKYARNEMEKKREELSRHFVQNKPKN